MKKIIKITILLLLLGTIGLYAQVPFVPPVGSPFVPPIVPPFGAPFVLDSRILLAASAVALQQQLYPPVPQIKYSCGNRNPSTVATLGDSRAQQLGAIWTEGLLAGEDFISFASIKGKKVLQPGQVKLDNLGAYGTYAKHWADLIRKCQAGGKNFETPTRVVVHLGGNDIGAYLGEKYKARHASSVLDLLGNVLKESLKTVFNLTKGIYSSFRKFSLKSFSRNPLKSLRSLFSSLRTVLVNAATSFTGNPLFHSPDFTTNWEWQDRQRLDEITTNMRDIILPHILDQGNNDHKIILNITQPVSLNAAIVGYAVQGTKDLSLFFRDGMKLMNGLREKYKSNVYLTLEKKYQDRILLNDTYWAFYKNIMQKGLTFGLGNSPTYYLDDGIHFTFPEPGDVSFFYNTTKTDNERKERYDGKIGNKGLVYWGLSIAMMMGRHGWFFPDASVGLNNYLDADIQKGDGIIFASTQAKGISTDDFTNTEIEPYFHGVSKYFPQEPIIITYPVMGVDVDFPFDNDKSFYYKNGDLSAYMVRGDIRTIFHGNGGPEGIFGYPLGEETVSSVFESYRTQNFECGTITKNYFDLIQPNKLNLNENLPTCLVKKARENL